MKVLITGIGGSGASYLADWILSIHPEIEVHGFSRWHSMSNFHVHPEVKVHEVDLLDFSSIMRGLEFQPDAVFHMASHANVRSGFDTPLSVLNNNIMGTANLLEAIKVTGLKPAFIMCSTSEVYGQVSPDEIPIKETCPCKPANPYAVSKLSQDALSYTYFLNYGIPVIRTRMFSYFNPRRKDLFATAFARQVISIEKGEKKILRHGNLDSVRTMIDIRDACNAYWMALKCVPGEAYNIGGETTMSVGDFLSLLKTYAKCEIVCEPDPGLMRPTDVTLQIPDCTKFKKQTGWKPVYTLEDSVRHLLDHCR